MAQFILKITDSEEGFTCEVARNGFDAKFADLIGGTTIAEVMLYGLQKMLIDEFDIENESISSFINNLTSYLKDLGFLQPIIFTISAYRSLLIKKFTKQEKLSRKERRELFSFLEDDNIFFDYGLIPFPIETINHIKCQKRFEDLDEDFQDYDYLNQIYCNTGFPYFEFYIKDQIFRLNK